MNTLYSYERAGVLLNNLASNEVLRQQLLSDPKKTLGSYGFDIDPNQIPASPSLMGNRRLEETVEGIHENQQRAMLAKAAIFIFLR